MALFLSIFHLTFSSVNPIGSNHRFISSAAEFFEFGKFDSSAYYFEKVLLELEGNNDWRLECDIRNRLVDALYRYECLDEAEKHARKNIDLCQEHLGKNDTITADALLNLGILCYLVGPTEMMTVYFKKALNIYEENFGHWHKKTALAYEWLGTTYEHNSDTLNSKIYLFESFKIWSNVKGKDHPDVGNIYRYLGLYYKRYGKLDSALLCFERSKKLFDKKLGESNPQSVKCLNNICDVFETQKHFDKAKLLYDHALNLIDTNDLSFRPVYLMTLFNLAEFYYNQKNYITGIQYFQKIYSIFAPGLDYSDILANPGKTWNTRSYYLRVILYYKARGLVEIYKSDTAQGLRFLIGAFQCYSRAAEIINSEKKDISNYEDFLAFSSRYDGLMVEMAGNALELYDRTRESKYSTAALMYLENNKDLEMLTLAAQPEEFEENIADSIYKKKKELLKDYLILKDKSISSKEKFSIKVIENEMLDESIQLDIFRWNNKGLREVDDVLEPDQESMTLQDVKGLLTENQLVVLFIEVCADHRRIPYEILVVLIGKDSFEYKRVDGYKVYQLSQQFYRQVSMLNQPHMSENAGLALYDILLKDIEKYTQVDELIIVPSQNLSIIPFDCLTIGFDEKERPVYLMQEYIIWRMFSLHELSKRRSELKDKGDMLLAMAPSFSMEKKIEISRLTKRDTSLINLYGAVEECRKISSIFPARLVLGWEATEEEFKSVIADYPLIHLSTHGVPADSTERNIQLAFSSSKDNTENGYLNMYEVFTMKLNTEMVVLSACKTGVGKPVRGAGNLNLAWAFSKAGARSSVVSLWDANDYASSVIMPAFYKYLAQGYKKPHALRQAKLDFIESSGDAMKNPYFWAGFEYYGDDGVVRSNDNSMLSYMILGSLISAGIIFIYFMATAKTFRKTNSST